MWSSCDVEGGVVHALQGEKIVYSSRGKMHAKAALEFD
jgi:hypothetical protein